MPPADQLSTVERHHSLREGLKGVDVVMGLRMQFERMAGDTAQTNKAAASDYYSEFGLTHTTLDYANPGAKVMHPGPMNRGIEIDSALADDPARSLISQQVFYGVALRMAILDALITKGE